MATGKLNPHDDVEYEVNVQIEGQKEPMTQQVFTSRKPEVAARHINRLVEDHNNRNGAGSMTLISAQIKDPELRASIEQHDSLPAVAEEPARRSFRKIAEPVDSTNPTEAKPE